MSGSGDSRRMSGSGICLSDGDQLKAEFASLALQSGNPASSVLLFVEVDSLDYQLVDGTAVAPLDYVDQAGTLSYAPGETEQTIELEIVGEFLNELRETFEVKFSNEINGALLDDGSTITVRDADPGAPAVPGVFAVYTLDDEFDTGVAVSLNHDAPLGDQLQLNPEGST
ncbi:MAG: hypothetical protein GY722_14960, partial [bacterium]|nr:hypothetical protein [bacterium]